MLTNDFNNIIGKPLVFLGLFQVPYTKIVINMAGGGIIVIGTTLIPLLSGLF